MDRDYPVTRGG